MMAKLVAGTIPALLMAAAAAPLAVQEWTVPWEGTRPRDPYVAPNGLVWFVGQEGNYIANLDPRTGKFDRYEIDEGTHPHNLVVAPDGMVWYTGNRNGHILVVRMIEICPRWQYARLQVTYPERDAVAITPLLDQLGASFRTTGEVDCPQ